MIWWKRQLLASCVAFFCGTPVFVSSAFAESRATQSPWRIETGIAAGKPTPLMLVAGVGYESAIFRFEGMGVHMGSNDYWCGLRGSLLWTFFRNLPFSVDLGVGGGYEFAEAPNEKHKALNRVNGGKYVYPYNYKESLDISPELWAHLYGFFTQVGYPVYFIRKHDEPKIVWRAGYLVNF